MTHHNFSVSTDSEQPLPKFGIMVNNGDDTLYGLNGVSDDYHSAIEAGKNWIAAEVAAGDIDAEVADRLKIVLLEDQMPTCFWRYGDIKHHDPYSGHPFTWSDNHSDLDDTDLYRSQYSHGFVTALRWCGVGLRRLL